MGTIFSTLGWLLMIVSVGLLIARPVLMRLTREVLQQNGQIKQEPLAPPIVVWFKPIRAFIFAFVALLMMSFNWFFFYSEAGMNYFAQYITGKQVAVTTPGYHLKLLGQVSPWKKHITIKASDQADAQKIHYTARIKAIPIRFIDQVEANASLALRFQLPEDPETFKALVLEFRSVENLTNSMLIPTTREIVENSAFMFAAQDYISGSAADFKFVIADQLKNGMYDVKKVEIGKDTTDAAIQNDSTQRDLSPVRVKYKAVIARDKYGKPIRTAHNISASGIITTQATVEKVELEDNFKKRLHAQRDEAAKRNLEQQKIKTATDARERIIAEGERDKAQERVNQEKEQVKKLIEIETKLKEEETKRKLAKIALETEKLNAQKVKVAADAQFYENQKLVSAGLTPLDRVEWEYKTAVGVAEKLSKTNWPQIMIMGEDGKAGGSVLYDLLGAEFAKTMLPPNKK